MEFNEKKLKKLLQDQCEEYQGYLGVLGENFISNMKLLAESVSGVQKQLVALRDMVARNTEDIEAIRISQEVTQTDVESIKHVIKKRVDIDEFTALEKRVAVLERRR